MLNQHCNLTFSKISELIIKCSLAVKTAMELFVLTMQKQTDSAFTHIALKGFTLCFH